VKINNLLISSALSIILFLPGNARSQVNTSEGFENFITRTGDRLYDGDEPYRFISVNMVEAFVVFTDHNMYANSSWRLPDDYELEMMVRSVRDMGGKCFRAWLLPCRLSTETTDFSHVVIDTSTNSITFRESSWERVDKLIQLCNEFGVRFTFVCGDNWDRQWGYWGDYGADFFTVGSQGYTNFLTMITMLLNRENTYTGVRYMDEKAILAWEPFNELWKDTGGKGKGVNDAWMGGVAAHIKSIDTNHLFIDGRLRPTDFYPGYTLFDDPNIDVVQANYYNMITGSMADDTREMRNFTRGKKPYIVGEIPPYSTYDQIEALLEEVETGLSTAAMMWCAKYPNRDGGWYFQNNYTMHWPGFPDSHPHGSVQEEARITELIADYAFSIRGMDRPPLAIPDAPELLPIADPGHISWKTSLGATSYQVFRAGQAGGPWINIGVGYDNLVVSNYLYYDSIAVSGESYYYRVVAMNSSSESGPSNVVGPIISNSSWLVDNYNYTTLLDSLSGVEIDFQYILPRPKDLTVIQHLARNDHGVLKRMNQQDGLVIYSPEGCEQINSVKVWSYTSSGSIRFFASEDGTEYVPVVVPVAVKKGDNIISEAVLDVNSYRFLKLVLSGSEDLNSPLLSRFEMAYQRGQNTIDTTQTSVYSDPDENTGKFIEEIK